MGFMQELVEVFVVQNDVYAVPTHKGALTVANITNGTLLYTVARKTGIAGQYTFPGAGIFATKLEASRAMRALGGGKDGNDSNLVVFSFPFGGPAVKEYTVIVRVLAKSQAEADAKVAAFK